MIFWYGSEYDELDEVYTKDELIRYVQQRMEKPGCELYVKVTDWISIISNTDSVIHDICIKDSTLIVHIKLWNEKIKQIRFCNYYMFKEYSSIGEEIGDIKIQTSSAMLDELGQVILKGEGALDEIAGVKSIVFRSVWDDTILLEVLAENIEFE